MTERMESTVRGRHGTKREGRKNGGDLTKSQISFILRCETPSEQGKVSLGVAEGKNKFQEYKSRAMGALSTERSTPKFASKKKLDRGSHRGKLVVADGYRKRNRHGNDSRAGACRVELGSIIESRSLETT